MHVYWLVHMTVIHYSALYDTEKGTVGMLILSRLPRILETEKVDISNTHIHDHSRSLVGTDTSIKLVVVNLVF
jgi:hypothetical protein